MIGDLRLPDPGQLEAYFALTEAVALLQHQVDQQLRAEGGISAVQFELLMTLNGSSTGLTMTQLADGVVYSRSGLTYQAGLLEKAGLVTRGPSPEDERATLVAITPKGREIVGRVLPGHIEVTRKLLYDAVDEADLNRLGRIMSQVRDHIRSEPPRSAGPRRRRRAAGI
ncbi:MarR family winged helix-turn-helix transcriptional regulator [Glycomyces paridis]|uniref:MarR family transcriptional regulator n=1 Tax=Glycomyces paridis TaxID=2126555 RepID=A0A4S8P2V8_9ACTN|nr:MarR family transcriptional regulator [Glycomyces paridis]